MEALEREEHLYILWTASDPDTSANMVLMYAANSLLRDWWKRVTVIVWGGAQKAVLDNEMVHHKFLLARQSGVEFSACISCAVNQGLTDRLKDEGIELIPWGEKMTEVIKEGFHMITI